MQGLLIYKFLLRRLFVLIFCFGLTACKEPPPLDIVKPMIDISHAERSIELDFEIDKPGNYQFALLFAVGWKGNNREVVNKWLETLGTDADSGEVLPVSLRLIKDGELFLEKRIDTRGTVREYIYYRDNGKSWTTTRVRNIDILQLPKGHYSAVISTVKDIPVFDYSSAYVQVISFTPESLAHNKKQTAEHEKRSNSELYGVWDFTKWLVKGYFCVLFCPEPLDIYQPIDVTHAGQSVRIDFEITKIGNYQFALLFDRGDYKEADRRLNIIGAHQNKGVIIPVSLYLVKDGKVVFTENINSEGSGGHSYIAYEGRKIDIADRTITILELLPGKYSAVITILEDVPAFSGIETFLQITHFKPGI